MCFAKLAEKFLVYTAQIMHVQRYTNVSQYIKAYGGKFLLVNFSIFRSIKHDEIFINYAILKNSYITEYDMKIIHNLSTGPHKNI